VKAPLSIVGATLVVALERSLAHQLAFRPGTKLSLCQEHSSPRFCYIVIDIAG